MKMSIQKKIERLDQKYKDKGGFTKFQQMVEGKGTLAQIGKHFGFSRQNAAGLYEALFNAHYSQIQRARRTEVQAKIQAEMSDLDWRMTAYRSAGRQRSMKKIRYIKIVREEAERRGFPVRILATRQSLVRVYINGYLCNISGTATKTIYHVPRRKEPTVYYRFAITTRPCDYCIFVLELGQGQYTYFIIPHEVVAGLTLVTLKDYRGERRTLPRGLGGLAYLLPLSKYQPYQEAWQFLMKPRSRPLVSKVPAT